MEEFRVGKHIFRWEPPDVTFLTYVGDLDGDSMHRLNLIARQFSVPRPYVLVLIDMSRVGTISPEARKRSTEDGIGVPMRGIAVFGASRAVRVVMSIVSRALELFRGGRSDNPTHFFATEAEARAWIVERRKTVLASS